MPVYNSESTIRRSLESVKNQTFEDFEFVIVDNNCTDSSMSIVNEFKNELNINIIKCETPGIVPALNSGLRAARGEWIARQDADDYWYRQKLEKQMDFLKQNPDVQILGTQIRLLDEEGQVQEKGTFGKEVRYALNDNEIKLSFMYSQNMICHPSVVYHRSLIDLLGGYEKLFPQAEDYHLWLRAFPHFKFANLDEVLVDYTQKKSESYDARVPVIMSTMYYELFKASGLVEGERKDIVFDWELNPGGHKHNV